MVAARQIGDEGLCEPRDALGIEEGEFEDFVVEVEQVGQDLQTRIVLAALGQESFVGAFDVGAALPADRQDELPAAGGPDPVDEIHGHVPFQRGGVQLLTVEDDVAAVVGDDRHPVDRPLEHPRQPGVLPPAGGDEHHAAFAHPIQQRP